MLDASTGFHLRVTRPMFGRFRIVPACDGRTDRHGDSIYRASIVSRGKKWHDTSIIGVRDFEP